MKDLHQDQSPTALVTGAGARVGRAIAYELARHHFHVILHYHRNQKGVEETLHQVKVLGGSGTIVQADLSQHSPREHLIQQVKAHSTHLKVLVNNASLFEPQAFASLQLEDWRQMHEVNLVAPYVLAQGLLTELTTAQGVIVNLCDISADNPLKGYAHYTASKAGLVGLTKALAVELAPRIRSVGISPGQVAWPPEYTDQQKQKLLNRIPMKQSGTPEDVARLVRFIVNEGSYLNGVIIPVDGGLSCRY